MILSIRNNIFIVKIKTLVGTFLEYWEKYLLTIGIEIGDIKIKKRGLLFHNKEYQRKLAIFKIRI